MLHLYNGLVLILIGVGVCFRHHRMIHVRIMVSSFILDMALVVYLEYAKNVIMEAFEHASRTTVQVHLTFAFTTLICYGIAIVTGRKLLQGKSVRFIHRTNAIVFLTVRTGVFITSFWVLPIQ